MSLRRGQRSDSVKELQHDLNALDALLGKSGKGFLPNSQALAEDRIFGPKTQAAVRALQEYYNTTHPEAPIAVDGIFGPATTRALDAFIVANGGTVRTRAHNLNEPYSPPSIPDGPGAGENVATSPVVIPPVVTPTATATPPTSNRSGPTPLAHALEKITLTPPPKGYRAVDAFRVFKIELGILLDPLSRGSSKDQAVRVITDYFGEIALDAELRSNPRSKGNDSLADRNRLPSILQKLGFQGSALSAEEIASLKNELQQKLRKYGLDIPDEVFAGIQSTKPQAIASQPPVPKLPVTSVPDGNTMELPTPLTTSSGMPNFRAAIAQQDRILQSNTQGLDGESKKMIYFSGAPNTEALATARTGNGANGTVGERACQACNSLVLIMAAGALIGRPVNPGHSNNKDRIRSIGSMVFGQGDAFPMGVDAMRSLAGNAGAYTTYNAHNIPQPYDIYVSNKSRGEGSHTGFIRSINPQRNGSVNISYIDDEGVTQYAMLQPGDKFIDTQKYMEHAFRNNSTLAAALNNNQRVAQNQR